MIEPDRARITHRSPEHLAVRLERLNFQTGGGKPGKGPVLARGVESARRRAHSEMAGNRDLLVPGIEPIALHADRDIKIEPDLHAKAAGKIAARPQLAVGGPLHEFDEFDLRGIGPLTKAGAFGLVGLPPFLRPFPPRLFEFMPQHLKT